MISVEVSGIEGVAEKARLLPSTMGVESAFESAGRRMQAILRDRTPGGYSQKLPASVMYEATEDGFVVGYDAGVESAGNAALESAARPRTQGRSVLARRQWVGVDELHSILDEAAEEGLDEVLSVIERSLSSGLS